MGPFFSALFTSLGVLTCWQDVILPDGLVKYAKLERARAMTYMEYNGISRDALLTVIDRFPSTKVRRIGHYRYPSRDVSHLLPSRLRVLLMLDA